MFISKDICPIPFDQQPINEYLALKESCFFSWVTLAVNKYLQTILVIFIVLFLIVSPVIFFSWPYSIFNFRFICLDLIIVTFIINMILVRLYLGWSYVMKRLLSATVFYEESGWYDGQLWIKTAEIMTKDRLVGLYELNPCMTRISYTLALSVIIWILEVMIY